MRKRIYAGTLLAASILLLVLLTGCSGIFKGNSQTSEEEKTDSIQENKATIDEIQQELEGFCGEDEYKNLYEKPEVKPNIYIDRNGYEPNDTKTAFFIGENLSNTFTVYRKEDGKAVYSGNASEGKKDTTTGKTVSRGDFSAITQEGSYYIQMEVIGQSYSFTISSDRYEYAARYLLSNWFLQTPETYFSDIEQEREQLLIFLDYILAYELYSDRIPQPDRYLEKLAQYAEYFLEQEDVESKDEFAAVMASYYSISEKGDSLASRCLSAAQKAYSEVARDQIYTAAHYHAAAALYKATGNSVYHYMIKNYLKQTNRKTDLFHENEFYGDMQYLKTEYTVDLDICEERMQNLLTEAGTMQAYSVADPYYACSEDTVRMDDHIFMNAMELAVIDYTIVSREYRELIKKQIHYFLKEKTIEELDSKEQASMIFLLLDVWESED